jgi:sortase A
MVASLRRACNRPGAGEILSSVGKRSAIPRVAEIAAWTLGLVLLALYGGLRARHTAVANREVREFKEARSLSWAAPNQSLWAPERIRAWQQNSAGAKPAAIAVLKIPRIGLEVPVLEGTSDANLDRGVGHIEGTPGPGAPGNVGIAGHRDGFFRGLKDVSPGDAVEVETRTLTFRYVVETLVLVDPGDVWVLDQMPGQRLTLVTCYPFYYTGSAPRRYIVQAVETSAAR